MKGKKVIADQSSAELDALRKTVHSLILVVRNLCTLGGVSANHAALIAILLAVGENIDNGTDIDGTGYTGTGLEIAGVIPQPKHPQRPSFSDNLVDIASTDL